IGVNNVSPASQQVDGSRAMVTQVAEDTPAARSGLKEGDMLLQVGKKKISDPEDVFDASFYISAGDIVPITVMRGNQKMIFHVYSRAACRSEQTSFPPAAVRLLSSPIPFRSLAESPALSFVVERFCLPTMRRNRGRFARRLDQLQSRSRVSPISPWIVRRNQI